jgi:hypothetical protein
MGDLGINIVKLRKKNVKKVVNFIYLGEKNEIKNSYVNVFPTNFFYE